MWCRMVTSSISDSHLRREGDSIAGSIAIERIPVENKQRYQEYIQARPLELANHIVVPAW